MNGIKLKPSILKANTITNSLIILLARVYLNIYKNRAQFSLFIT